MGGFALRSPALADDGGCWLDEGLVMALSQVASTISYVGVCQPSSDLFGNESNDAYNYNQKV